MADADNGQDGVNVPEEIPATDSSTAPASAPQPPETIFTAARSGDEVKVKELFVKSIEALAAKHKVNAYEVVILFDDLDSISDFHSDQIYRGLGAARDKDILLLIHSRGGRIEPAYLISKTCKKSAANKFVVAVPRKAKSAATLISLGADEIHLGMLSQLGPIDPQVNDLPALGLANGLTKVTQLVAEFPKSSEMWAKYLSENLSLRHLGYLERLGESCAQYAERLLRNKVLPPDRTAKQLADHFVNHYMDHSFLIDVDEATSLLGGNVVRTNTPEYAFANEVYQEFNFLEFVMRYFQKKEIYFVGSLTTDSLFIRDKKTT